MIKIINISNTPESFLITSLESFLSCFLLSCSLLLIRATTNLFSLLLYITLHFLEFYINKSHCNFFVCVFVWLSLNIIILWFIHVVSWISSLFLFICWMIFHSMEFSHPVYYFSVHGHLGYFEFWLLQIKLLWLFICKCLCGHLLSLLLDKYLRMKWQDHLVGE